MSLGASHHKVKSKIMPSIAITQEPEVPQSEESSQDETQQNEEVKDDGTPFLDSTRLTDVKMNRKNDNFSLNQRIRRSTLQIKRGCSLSKNEILRTLGEKSLETAGILIKSRQSENECMTLGGNMTRVNSNTLDLLKILQDMQLQITDISKQLQQQQFPLNNQQQQSLTQNEKSETSSLKSEISSEYLQVVNQQQNEGQQITRDNIKEFQNIGNDLRNSNFSFGCYQTIRDNKGIKATNSPSIQKSQPTSQFNHAALEENEDEGPNFDLPLKNTMIKRLTYKKAHSSNEFTLGGEKSVDLEVQQQNSIEPRNLDIIIESVEETKQNLVCSQSMNTHEQLVLNNQNREEGNDEELGRDFDYDSFEKQLELQLKNEQRLKVKKVPSHKKGQYLKKVYHTVQAIDRAKPSDQNKQDCIDQPINQNIVSGISKTAELIENKHSVINQQARRQTIAKPLDIVTEETYVGNDSFQETHNCHSSLEKSLSRQIEDDIKQNNQNYDFNNPSDIDQSEMQEELLMELFDQPIKYTTDGIQICNEIEQQTVDFCVKIGLDPKYMGNIFKEIAQQRKPQQQNAFGEYGDQNKAESIGFADFVRTRKATVVQSKTQPYDRIIPSRKHTMQLPKSTNTTKQVSRCQSNDEINFVLPQFGETESKQHRKSVISHHSDKSKLAMMNLLSKDTTNISEHSNKLQTQKEMQWIQIQISIMTKRIQSFYEEETRRVKSINNLQSIIQQQNRHILQLVKIHQAEQKQLNFAFMFASPLVLSFDAQNQTKLHMIPQLNYRKEFKIIKQKLNESKAKVTITRQQCTFESLQEVLRQKPLGLHYSGNGIQNTFDNIGDLQYQYKNEGDFLILETHEGDSKLVSRQKLQNLLSTACCKLNFVFVSSFHSDFVGRIFLEAGADHVICIRNSEEIGNDSVQHFTSTFYSEVFRQKLNICEAFEQAQLSVRTYINTKEAEAFQLLLRNRDLKNKQSDEKLSMKDSHKCFVFGPFSLGNLTVIEPCNVTFKTTIKQQHLIGRQKDMYILIQKIMSINNHLITLMGLPGVGKSSLVKATLQYIQDRSLLKGGLIITDARSINNCELFVRKLNNQLISENQFMFGSAKQHNQSQSQDCLSTFILIISKISYIKEEILMVIDNCEELIRNDRQNFKVLISTILATISSIKILLTSRNIIGSGIKEANEEIVVLSGLNTIQTLALIKLQLNREISNAEITALMKIKPNQEQYPTEIGARPNKLHEHHLFKLLGGNPQSISLITPLLNNQTKNIQLSDLYKMLTSDKISEIQKTEQIEDQMMASLRMSVQVSVNMINESDSVSMQLFFLLGLMPGGIRFDDLNEIWKIISNFEKSESINKTLTRILTFKSVTSGLSNVSQNHQENDKSPWEAAIQQLELNHLIEEVFKESTMSIKKSEKIESSEDEKDSSESERDSINSSLIIYDKKSSIAIQMPKFVRDFAEAMIEPNELQFFQMIFADFFKQNFLHYYLKNSNSKESVTSHSQNKITAEINHLEQNMDAFIQRMHEKFGFQVSQPLEESKNLLKVKPNLKKLQSYDNNFQQKNKLNNMNKDPIVDQQMQLPGKLPFKKRNSVQIVQGLEQENDANKAQSSDQLGNPQQWNKLLQNYQQILIDKEKDHKLISLIEIIQRNMTIKPTRGTLSSHQFAKLMWRWAVNRALKSVQQKKNAFLINRGKTQILAKNELEQDVNESAQDSLQQNTETDEGDEERFLRIEKLEKNANVRFSRASCHYRRDTRKQEAYVKKKTQKRLDNIYKMSDEELAVLYYLSNLVLISRFTVVRAICEKNLLFMIKATCVFKGNVKRFLAYSIYRLYSKKDEYIDESIALCIEQKTKIFNLLDEAYSDFKNGGCKWGMGVCRFFQGKVFLFSQEKSSFSGFLVQSINLKQAKSFLSEALEIFKLLQNLRGIVLSGQELIQLLKDDQPQDLNRIIVEDNDQNFDIQMLESTVNKSKIDLRIAQSKMKQNIYIPRVQGEEESLLSDVIRSDQEAEFKEISLRVDQIPDRKKKRFSVIVENVNVHEFQENILGITNPQRNTIKLTPRQTFTQDSTSLNVIPESEAGKTEEEKSNFGFSPYASDSSYSSYLKSEQSDE